MAIDIRRVTRLAIGINTENGVEEYRFDIWPWREEHPQLNEFQINVTPPGGMPYKAQTHMDGFYLVWPITDRDTALPGDDGWYEIEAFGEGGLHKLSPKKPLVVYERMTGDLGEAPSSIQSWVEEANAVLDDNRKAVNEAQQAAASANNAAEQANSAAEKIKTATNTSLGVVKGGRGILVKEDGSLFNANVANLLDNGDFRNPVNQRGAISYSAAGYTIDRWRLNGALPMSLASGYITFDNQYSEETLYLEQRIPLERLTTGKTYTVAVMTADGVIACGSCTLSSTLTSTAATTSYYVQLNTGTDCGRLQLRIRGGFSVSVVWVALYEGAYTADTLPAYQYKGYAAEWAECLRYYYHGTDQYSIVPYYFSTAERYYTVMLPAKMRIPPTVQYLNTSGEYKCGWLPTGATVSITSTSPEHFTMCCTGGDINETDRPLLFMTYAASADL